ncbi:heme-dependent catalase [Polyplosphaeria fusca]|uniref:Heme-dependent catalase n=1 Tax=Polyplosphaeria fusca TaxID=682080 RepID=A0A9P4UXG5_9PLEO|nr:heme-dependent catalase [Polyplosphaeria fusca]
MFALRALNNFFVGLMRIERRVDPFIRPLVDALAREPLTRLVQWLIRTRLPNHNLGLAEEHSIEGEEKLMQDIIANMSHYLRTHYEAGKAQRGGNTKTHGVVRGELVIHDNLPEKMRHGIFEQPGRYPAWVRFSGPGPGLPPDIDDVGVLSIGVKVMGVPGPKLLDDERFTQDFTGITTPVFTTPDLTANAKLQAAVRRGLPLFYFFGHVLDALMQALWSRTQTSPLESDYWGCVPYLLGEGQAMQYRFRPVGAARSRIPRLPGRPSDNYLREAMARTLTAQPARFDMLLQLQTNARRMPIENASVRWEPRDSPPVVVATLELPSQRFDTDEQLAFASRLSINPWHCLPAHRPLGNQNRGRLKIYQALSQLRQHMNDTPHVEPDGSETFDPPLAQ